MLVDVLWRLLRVDQKQKRIDDSKRCLELFQRNKKHFFMRYVTMGGTWIHHYTPESNRQSVEWTAKGENCPKQPKTQKSAGKVVASVFCDSHGILFMDYFEEGKTINNYYMTLLDRLSAEIKNKRPHMQNKKVLFHQDNSPCHKSIATKANFKCILNCFPIQRILRIWLPATTTCLQT